MNSRMWDNAKLGLFVMAGLTFIIFSLYMVGKNRSLFGSTFTVYATFSNVNGLVAGNNVRFAGIDVGTVHRVEIQNDSSILVTMIIDRRVQKHLRQNAVATISTDGLMGNKLININPQPGQAPPLEERTVLRSRTPVETDEMLRTLNTTNDNIFAISDNLREITGKLNSNNSLWTLLSDTTLALEIEQSVRDIRRTSSHAEEFTASLKAMAEDLRHGDGLVADILEDTTAVKSLNDALASLERTTNNAEVLTENLKVIVDQIQNGKGTAGILLADTVWAQKLHNSIQNVEEGTAKFSENMEAMRSNWLFRGYFKKMEKQAAKEKSQRK